MHQRCFDAVKAALVNASTLAHPDFDKPFLILTDASSRFLSAALIQLDDEGQPQPVAYASIATEPAMKAYGVSDLEGACVVWCTRLTARRRENAKEARRSLTLHRAGITASANHVRPAAERYVNAATALPPIEDLKLNALLLPQLEVAQQMVRDWQCKNHLNMHPNSRLLHLIVHT